MTGAGGWGECVAFGPASARVDDRNGRIAGMPGDLLASQHVTPVRREESQVNVQGGSNHVLASATVTACCHRPVESFGAVLVRYRYRLYPSPGQQQALARVFGCARVVFNDCLRLREEMQAAGATISVSEAQRRGVTLAKRSPEREWLSEASSVALVQACNDARRAYRNWFDSASGKRKGPKIGHPRFRRKHARQSIRLTRNGFSLRGQRLYVAKAREIRVCWSRPLPSEPSACTGIRVPTHRYAPPIVVHREAAPLR